MCVHVLEDTMSSVVSHMNTYIYIYITSSLSISFWSVVVVGGGSDRGVGLENCGGRGGRGTNR